MYEFRPTDEDFKERPTIELLFLSGYNEDSTNHFLFLRRFLCDGLPLAPPAVQPSLLDTMYALPISDDPWDFSGDITDETWEKLRISNRKQTPAHASTLPTAKAARSQTMDRLASMRPPANSTVLASESQNEAAGSTSPSTSTDPMGAPETRNMSASSVDIAKKDVPPPALNTAKKAVPPPSTNKSNTTQKISGEDKDNTQPQAAGNRLVGKSVGGSVSTREEVTKNTIAAESHGESATGRERDENTAESLVELATGIVVTTTSVEEARTTNDLQSIHGSTTAEVVTTAEPAGTVGATGTTQSIGGLTTDGPSASKTDGTTREQEEESRKRAAQTHAARVDIVSAASDDENEEHTTCREEVFAKLKQQTSHEAYKRKSTKAKCRQRAMDQLTLNKMYERKEISNSRLLYDDKEDKFYSCKPFPTKAGYTKRVLEENPEEFGEFVYETALKRPGQWIGPRLGDAGDEDAPEELCCTSVRLLYQQHRKPYCLILSLASALDYCGIQPQARWIAETAEPMSKMETDEQITALLPMMRNFVPVIGNAYIYGVRTKGHKREKRSLSWYDLFTSLTEYPTLIIPMLPNGDTTHAFCVVDDLIFDSSTPFALKLTMESVNWIFGNKKVDLNKAYRFCKRWSPENHKCEGEYKHKLTLHWDRSEMGLTQIEESTEEIESL